MGIGVQPVAADDVDFIRVIAAVAARRHERLLAAAEAAYRLGVGVHMKHDDAHACLGVPYGAIAHTYSWPGWN